jgi:nucleoside phosphorylase
MPLVYIFAASKMEAQPVLVLAGCNAAPAQGSTGVIIDHDGDRFAVIITGMGTGNAEATADAVLGVTSGGARGGSPVAEKPDAILVIGLCGGLTEPLSEGRIVAYSECLSAEPGKPPLSCSSAITTKLLPLLASSNISCDRVTGVTSPRIATNREERLRLAQTGASAVDMETYSILDAATRAGVPVAVLRFVRPRTSRPQPRLESGRCPGRSQSARRGDRLSTEDTAVARRQQEGDAEPRRRTADRAPV